MKMFTLICCGIFLVNHVMCYDEGFDLFFKTNLEEMNDVPIHFDPPVPTWIKGTLVSLYECLLLYLNFRWHATI